MEETFLERYGGGCDDSGGATLDARQLENRCAAKLPSIRSP